MDDNKKKKIRKKKEEKRMKKEKKRSLILFELGVNNKIKNKIILSHEYGLRYAHAIYIITFSCIYMHIYIYIYIYIYKYMCSHISHGNLLYFSLNVVFFNSFHSLDFSLPYFSY